MALGLFDGGHIKRLALKIEPFLGPEMATSEVSAIWAQKSPMALEMDLHASKSLHLTPYKQQVH